MKPEKVEKSYVPKITGKTQERCIFNEASERKRRLKAYVVLCEILR